VKTEYITVGSGVPVANFTADITSAYAPLTVQFTDTSTVNPASWSWDFGDNTTSTEQHPVHTYTTAGTYTVTLTVANDYGNDIVTKADCIYAGSGCSQNLSFTACDTMVYQQEVVIHRSAGDAYEENADGLRIWHIFVGDQCREDYGDIRFTDAGGTPLPYYLWPDYTSEQARFFVRLENADQPGTLEVLYGDPGVTTTSDADATGYALDTFSTLNANWDTSGVASATIDSGRLKTDGKTSTWGAISSAAVKQPVTPISDAFSADIDLTYTGESKSCRGELYLVLYNTSTSYTAIGYYDSSSSKSGGFRSVIGGTVYYSGSGSRDLSGSMHLTIIRDAANTVSVYENGVLRSTGTMTGDITSIGLTNTRHSSTSYPGDTAYWDNLVIRAYSVSRRPPPVSCRLRISPRT
jgi:PKD repeat protein